MEGGPSTSHRLCTAAGSLRGWIWLWVCVCGREEEMEDGRRVALIGIQCGVKRGVVASMGLLIDREPAASDGWNGMQRDGPVPVIPASRKRRVLLQRAIALTSTTSYLSSLARVEARDDTLPLFSSSGSRAWREGVRKIGVCVSATHSPPTYGGRRRRPGRILKLSARYETPACLPAPNASIHACSTKR